MRCLCVCVGSHGSLNICRDILSLLTYTSAHVCAHAHDLRTTCARKFHSAHGFNELAHGSSALAHGFTMVAHGSSRPAHKSSEHAHGFSKVAHGSARLAHDLFALRTKVPCVRTDCLLPRTGVVKVQKSSMKNKNVKCNVLYYLSEP